jgi:adenylate kinase
MFREAVAQGPSWAAGEGYMDRGELVPEVTIGMSRSASGSRTPARVVFDGYPRRSSAKALDAALERQQVGRHRAHINASDDELVRRLGGRWLCPPAADLPRAEPHSRQAGVCDNCAGKLSQREDDKAEVVRQRLQKQRPPAGMLDYYRTQGKLVDVDGQQDIDTLTRELLEAISRTAAAAKR